MRLHQPHAHARAPRHHSAAQPGRMQAVKSLRAPEIIAFGLVGLTIGAALIVSLHYLSNSRKHTADGKQELTAIAAPIPVLQTKEDPLIPPAVVRQAALSGDAWHSGGITQVVARSGKADMLVTSLFEDAVRLARPAPREKNMLAQRLLPSPPVWKLEKNWRMARLERRRVLERRKKRMRELACLAKAIYFEARSESLKGQMAVAKVVLNRVRDPRFPNTICGVVYQGAERRNACQFSFACDGKSDYPTNRKQWRLARRLAAKALKGQIRLRGFEGVAFYHADYVRPTWASMMQPVVKIGRHIFYRDS